MRIPVEDGTFCLWFLLDMVNFQSHTTSHSHDGIQLGITSYDDDAKPLSIAGSVNFDRWQCLRLAQQYVWHAGPVTPF